MDTKKFNANGQGKAKAGRDNTKVILTAAGVAAAAAGATAAHVFGAKEEVEHVDNPEEVTPQEKPVAENEEQKPEQNPEAKQETAAASGTEGTVSGDDISQPQPTTGNTTQSNPSQEPTQPTEGETPQEVAEAIAHAEEIDSNDIDAPAMVEIDGFTSAYDENGNEIAAVEVHSQDGTPFLMADMDNDGVYESLFDTEGNFVVHTEANLTHSDLEAMMDQTGGFLAINEQDHTTLSEDPTNDIIDTETGTHPEMAVNETATPEETGAATNTVSEQDVAQEPSADEIDNLLAELLGDNTDSDSKGIDEEVLVDEYGGNDDEPVDDDDSDDDLDDDLDDDVDDTVDDDM